MTDPKLSPANTGGEPSGSGGDVHDGSPPVRPTEDSCTNELRPTEGSNLVRQSDALALITRLRQERDEALARAAPLDVDKVMALADAMAAWKEVACSNPTPGSIGCYDAAREALRAELARMAP